MRTLDSEHESSPSPSPSDSKFTIFKDASGQYITRIVNLRDGRVTYIPEPEAVSYLNSRLSAQTGMALDA